MKVIHGSHLSQNYQYLSFSFVALCPILDKKKFAPFFWGAISSVLKRGIHAKIKGKLV